MKFNKWTLIVSLIALVSFNTGLAQTNLNQVPNLVTNDATSDDGTKLDLTIGAAGTSYNGHNTTGLSISGSVNPFSSCRSLWFGINQSVYWQPTFSGSTDVDINWNYTVSCISDNLCVLPGWGIGSVYGADAGTLWRTGPDLQVQYYTSDKAYIYGQIDYDAVTQQGSSAFQTRGDNNGVRWSVGIGIELGLLPGKH